MKLIMWHIETSGAICSPQAGLQHSHCPFSVDDGETLVSYSLLEWSVSAMSSLGVIIDVRMRGLLNPTSENIPFWVTFMTVT